MFDSNRGLRLIGQGLLAIILGYAAVFLVNYVGGLLLESIFGSDRPADGLPVTTPAQIADLLFLFAAGLAGAFVVVLVALRWYGMHAIIFGLIALVIDLFFVLDLPEMPLWYRVLVIATVPPQVWAGARLGIAFRKRRGN